MDKVSLKRIREEDLKTIMNWRLKPDVTDFLFTDPVLTIDKQREWFKFIEKDEKSDYWMVDYDGVRVGLIWLQNIDHTHMRAEFGIFNGEKDKYSGYGIFKTALLGLFRYVFEELRFRKVYCEVLSSNLHAISNVYLRCGMQIEGIFKDYIYKRDTWHDVIRLSILADQWERQANQMEYSLITEVE